MKKLSYFLGLVAMAVMMTMTSCSKGSDDAKKGSDDVKKVKEDAKKVSDEVKLICDVLDGAAAEVENAETEQELESIMNSLDEFGPEVDEETELTNEDKEALKTSFMNFMQAVIYKTIEFTGESVSDTMVQEQLDVYENQVDEMLAESKTLGDFANKL